MPLWLSELLADPGFGAEVVAGQAGVDRRGPIRWAHISELPDPTPWLEGGELLLTTGLGVRDDPELQDRFVAGVADRGAVAIGISIGVSMDAVPAVMRDRCDALGLPLFTMPYEIPFIAVSRQVAHHVFSERYATLNRTVDLHRQVLAAVVGGAGIAEVLSAVAGSMPGVALLVQDFSGAELARVDPGGTAVDLGPTLLQPGPIPNRPGGPLRSQTMLRGRQVLRVPVLLADHLEAYVMAVSPQPLLEHEELLFEQAVAGVSLELARTRSVRAARRGRIDELLEEIASGRSTTARIVRVLDRLEARLPPTYEVLALSRPRRPEVELSAVCTLVEDILLPEGPPLVGHLDDTVYACVAVTTDTAQQILGAALQRGWRGMSLGRSRPKEGPDALPTALREAGTALLAAGEEEVRDIAGLGVAGLLAGLRDTGGATDFVEELLGPVLAHDRLESAQLVDTLRAYLTHGCRPGPAAQELGVHRHTLAYRLDRIRDLTERDPRSGEHLVSFGLALELLERWEP